MKRKFLFFLLISMFLLHLESFGKENPDEIRAYIEKIDKIVSVKKSQSFKRNRERVPKGKEYISSYYADKVITEYHGDYHLVLDAADEHLMLYYEINKKNEPYGVYKLYDENEKLIEIGFLEKEGIRSGTIKTFYPTGELKSKIPYFHGKIVGSFKKYYKSGKIQQISEQNAEGIHGKSRIFYENGKVNISQTWKNGKREGEYLEYFEDGKIKEQLFFKKGELVKNK